MGTARAEDGRRIPWGNGARDPVWGIGAHIKKQH
jgi:hypothetical protein